MVEYGVEESGFVIKPLDVLITEAAALSTSLFGTNIDVSDSSPLGKINQTVLTEMAIQWEKLNTTYLAGFLDSASGVNLDKIVELLGVWRKEAVRSTGYVVFSGTPGTTVPGSTAIKTVDDSPIIFKSDTSLILADIIINGAFTTDTSSWTAENNATLASVSKKLDFTSGGTHEVIVGDTLTGETGGATAVVSAIVLSGGSWAGGDAAGTFYFSAQTGTFEAETLKEVANLNVCNVASDSTDTSGADGNAMLVICDGTNNPFAEQTIVVVENDIYDFSVFIKAGTAATYNVDIYDDTNAAYIYESGDLTETAEDWSTEVSQHITIPSGCLSISIRLIHRATSGDATTMLFDSCELVRGIPITAADAGVDGNVSIGTIISLSSPISGITSVTNPTITTGGLEKETDVALRIRTKQSIGAGGKATLNAIVAELLAVDDVASATIEENDTDTDYLDMLTNSGFDSDTASWTLGNGATLASIAGGESGNCLRITGDGADADPYAYQAVTVIPGNNYLFTVYVKEGTEATYNVKIYDVTNSDYIYESGDLEAAGDWSTSVTKSFTAPTGCVSARIELYQIAPAAATTMLFDTAILNGLPPHSVRVSVQGGTDTDVAQALLDSVAAGIRAYGTDSGTGELDNGQSFVRYFDRPTPTLMTISATIVSDDTYVGDDAVETAIITYIGGTDQDDAIHVGLGAGGDVVFYEVVSAIMDVTGVTNVTGLTVNAGTSDISIATNEVAYATVASITLP